MLRRVPGCLKADAFAASAGHFAIFQTWISEAAATRFNGDGIPPAPAFKRLEV